MEKIYYSILHTIIYIYVYTHISIQGRVYGDFNSYGEFGNVLKMFFPCVDSVREGKWGKEFNI